MKKLSLLILLFAVPLLSFGQIFKFVYTGSASCPTPNNTPVIANPNITVTPLTRQGVNCSATASSFNSNAWPTTSVQDNGSFVEVTVNASSGYQLNLASFSFDIVRSTSGPGSARVAMDSGNGVFSQTYDFTPTESYQTITWDFPDTTVSSGYTVRFRIYGWAASAGTGTLRLNNIGLFGAVTQSSGNSGNTGSSPFTVSGSNVGLDKTPTQKLDVNGNIRTSGKLLVGNISDGMVSNLSNYSLAVNGSAVFTLATVKLYSNWPDYVFTKSYKLTPLEEVEKHIAEKGHLPNIPSAEEISENGINLGDMDARLLEKIEELTLYTIEQNKKLKDQDEKIRNLEKIVLEFTSKK